MIVIMRICSYNILFMFLVELLCGKRSDVSIIGEEWVGQPRSAHCGASLDRLDQLGAQGAPCRSAASITAPATCGHSASPDNVLVGIS